MFYYYGAKNALARYYPAPAYGTIVEPFAGSAAYAQYYGAGRSVVLIERDEHIVDLWHRLQTMTAAEIRALPCPVPGTYGEPWELSDALVKMCAASNGVLRMSGALKVPDRVGRVWPGMIGRMAERVDLIRNWKIVCADYTAAPRVTATWFVDPPYQLPSETTNGVVRGSQFPLGSGYLYGSSGIDYAALRNWVLDLPGQVIVCEQVGARWLDGWRTLRDAGDSQGVVRREVYMTWDNQGLSPERYLQEHSRTQLTLWPDDAEALIEQVSK